MLEQAGQLYLVWVWCRLGCNVRVMWFISPYYKWHHKQRCVASLDGGRAKLSSPNNTVQFRPGMGLEIWPALPQPVQRTWATLFQKGVQKLPPSFCFPLHFLLTLCVSLPKLAQTYPYVCWSILLSGHCEHAFWHICKSWELTQDSCARSHRNYNYFVNLLLCLIFCSVPYFIEILMWGWLLGLLTLLLNFLVSVWYFVTGAHFLLIEQYPSQANSKLEW